MSEFTGERVIPGQVNDDLWAEHIARYAFAANYSHGRVLDLGCGAGYGTAELARRAELTIGLDVAEDAIAFARSNYGSPKFLQGSVTALPFAAQAFHLITAFEVIEHIEDWPALISEARRVLRPDGIFLVSTPNRLYYTESRGEEGTNPFHVHEFTFAEFNEALQRCFPHVVVLQQNRTETFVFSGARGIQELNTRIDAGDGNPDDAHFFVAVCGIESDPRPRSFIYVPSAANLLREREQHIKLLQDELRLTKNTLADLQADHHQLVQLHDRQTQELEEHNRWTLKVEADWRAALERIAQLQEELRVEQAAGRATADAYAQKVAELEEDNRAKTQWAIETEQRLSGELAAKCDELVEAVRLLDQAEATVTERTLWAQKLQTTVEQLEAQLSMIRESRWIRMGRMVGLGPRVPNQVRD